MVGFRDGTGAGLDIRVAAIPAVTVVIGFGDSDLTVDSVAGSQVVDGFVAGFTQGTMRIRSEKAECVEVRLAPSQAYPLLGISPADLGGAVVGVEDVFGRRARSLRERLAAATTWEQRFAYTKSLLAQCEPKLRPDAEVVASWERIVGSRGRVKVSDLADSCGWSRKRLWGRFESQIGLTPKRAAMLVRFRHAVDGLLAGRPAADVAVDCGYTDQSHLCRDVASFAEITPGAVAGEPLTAIAKLRHQAWGTFVQDGKRSPGRQ